MKGNQPISKKELSMLLVPPRGLEPLRLSTQVPKTWVSANSTIAAYGGEGGTRTHKPLITTDSFQDCSPHLLGSTSPYVMIGWPRIQKQIPEPPLDGC